MWALDTTCFRIILLLIKKLITHSHYCSTLQQNGLRQISVLRSSEVHCHQIDSPDVNVSEWGFGRHSWAVMGS